MSCAKALAHEFAVANSDGITIYYEWANEEKTEVTVSDAKKFYDADISAPKKFKVSVYALKTGFDNSDTVTAEFDFSSDTARSGDVDGDGKVNVADHVKLSEIIINQNE
jgi:hypothetical protein